MGDTGTWRRVREGTRQRREGRAGAEHEGPHARRHWCALLWSHTGLLQGAAPTGHSHGPSGRAALWYGEERAGGRRAGGASDS